MGFINLFLLAANEPYHSSRPLSFTVTLIVFMAIHQAANLSVATMNNVWPSYRQITKVERLNQRF